MQYFVYQSDQRKRGGDKHVLVSDIDNEIRNELDKQKVLAEKIAIILHKDGAEHSKALIDELRSDFRNQAMIIVQSERARMGVEVNGEEQNATECVSNLETDIDNVVEALEPAFAGYPERVRQIELAYSDENPWLQLMLSWDSSYQLNRDVLRKYVSRVVIDQLTTISVELKAQEWLLALPAEWRC